MKKASYSERIAELRHERAQLIMRSTVLREELAVHVERLHTPINIGLRVFSLGRFLFAHPWIPTLLSSVVLARGARGIGIALRNGIRWWRTAHAVVDGLGLLERGNK